MMSRAVETNYSRQIIVPEYRKDRILNLTHKTRFQGTQNNGGCSPNCEKYITGSKWPRRCRYGEKLHSMRK